MTAKLTIEIENIDNKCECIAAVRKLYAAVKERHGESEARSILLNTEDIRSPEWWTRATFDEACYSFSDQELRLLLHYYAMPKPNKEKLARDLAKKKRDPPRPRTF
jgi:hypothetical protein